MCAQLAQSFSFIASETPADFIGLGVIQLPARNFFQSIGDFFAEKSGKQRISFMAIGAHEIKKIHTQSSSILQSTSIPKNLIESISLREDKTRDGLVSITHIDIVECISVTKKGKKKLKSHYFKLMPALLGENTSPIQNIAEITAAHASTKAIIETLKAWELAIKEAN
jgi:hypothetical protein